jgi:hypothetical protein
VDDLEVKTSARGVVISRPSGLSLMPQEQIDTLITQRQTTQRLQNSKTVKPAASQAGRIFNFSAWEMGGPKTMRENEMVILGTLSGDNRDRFVENLITLGKMYLANGLWAEAEGMLNFAATELPEIQQNSEFKGLMGATQVLGNKNEEAFAMLSADPLKPFNELGYWRAVALGETARIFTRG